MRWGAEGCCARSLCEHRCLEGFSDGGGVWVCFEQCPEDVKYGYETLDIALVVEDGQGPPAELTHIFHYDGEWGVGFYGSDGPCHNPLDFYLEGSIVEGPAPFCEYRLEVGTERTVNIRP